MKHPLLTAAERAIAARREAKAQKMAEMAYAYEIPAAELERATDREWAQLVEVARRDGKENYGVPSKVTRALVLMKLRALEGKQVAA
jgi:hypothetical protein